VPPSPLLSALSRHEHILDRDDQKHRPHDQRQDAEHRLGACRGAMLGGGLHGFAKGVERAGADIAVDDSREPSAKAQKRLSLSPFSAP
jgi:hypothetical protein